MARNVAAGLVIFRRFNSTIQYLLLQTSYGNHHWTPPKGFVDVGETNEMVTALRETEEESGLKQSDYKIFEDCKKTLIYNVKGKSKTVIYWLAELLDPNTPVTLSDEHQDMKWLPLQEACVLGQYDEMKELLIFCNNYIHEHLL